MVLYVEEPHVSACLVELLSNLLLLLEFLQKRRAVSVFWSSMLRGIDVWYAEVSLVGEMCRNRRGILRN